MSEHDKTCDVLIFFPDPVKCTCTVLLDEIRDERDERKVCTKCGLFSDPGNHVLESHTVYYRDADGLFCPECYIVVLARRTRTLLKELDAARADNKVLLAYREVYFDAMKECPDCGKEHILDKGKCWCGVVHSIHR